jgi:hypothetical protein
VNGRVQGAWVWARAEIRARWRGLVAVGLLIGLVGAVALTLLAGARRTDSAYGRFREATLAHDATAFGPASLLQRLAALPEVAATGVATIYPAFIDFESEYDLGIFAAHDDRLLRTVDRGHLVSGRRADPRQVNEVMLSPQAATQLRAAPGDRVRLQTLTPEQIKDINTGQFSGELEGPVLDLRVTGVLRNVEDLRGETATFVIYATPAFQRAHGDDIGKFVDIATFRLSEGSAGFPRFAGRARPVLGNRDDATIEGFQDVSQSIEDSIDVLTVALAVLGAAALVVGVVAGGQALGRQLWLAAPDQPALGAMGLTRRTRTAAVALAAFPAIGLGALIAGIGAFLASPLTPINLGRQAEPDPGLAFDAVAHVGGALGLAVVMGVITALVAWRVARVHDGVVARSRPTVATRLAAGVNLGPSATTGIRHALERHAGRAALPVRSALAAALVAVAGVAGSLTFAASLHRLETTPARYGVPWDLQPELFGEVDPEDVARLPDVGDAARLHRADVQFGSGDTASAYAFESVKGEVAFTVLDGRLPSGAGEMALGGDLLRRLGTQVGRTVVVRTEDGERTLRVVGQVLTPSSDQGPMAGGAVLPFVNLEAFEALTRTDDEVVDVLRWRPGVDPVAAERRLKAAFPDAVNAYSTPRAPGEVTNLARVGSLPQAFGAFLAVVGVAALLHALVISGRRRRHDMAVLRAMGFVRRQLGASVAWQSSTIAVVGLVAGIPLGIAAGRWVWIVVADGVGVASDPLVPVAAGALVVLGALVVANVLAAPLGWRAARVPAATVLRTE